MQSLEVYGREDVGHLRRGDIKFGEYLDFAARDKRIDVQLSRDIHEILLEHLQRNYTRSLPPVLCHEVARASLFSRVKFVVRVEEYVGVEEATNAHEPRRD